MKKEVPDPIFLGSKAYTLGVELEFQLIDRNTFDLVPKGHDIMDSLACKGCDKVSTELVQSTIEIKTAICDNIHDVASDLQRTVQLLENTAKGKNYTLYAAGLHPFARPIDQEVSDGKRFGKIMNELQYVGRQFMFQGMHVHVGVENDGDTAIRVCDIIQPYLPVLLALSSSSPFFCGIDTGFHSYRTKLSEMLPLAGIAGYLGTWQSYVDEVNFLLNHKVVEGIKDLWWDVRPRPNFGTVEIRICDMPSTFSETLGLTAVIQSLAAYIIDSKISSAPVMPKLLEYNKWQAARHGLDGRFIDVYGLLDSSPVSLRQAAATLLNLIEPFTESFKTNGYILKIYDIIKSGTSADRQRNLIKNKKNHKKMISCMSNDYWM